MADKDLKVNISEFVLINYSREYAIDIKRLCSQFNLYQDLFSSVMTFTATINDSNGLLERFPMIGEEIVGISFKNRDETKKEITKVFNVYRVSNRNSEQERKESFVIHGISYEARVDMVSSVDRSFAGATFSDMVESVYDEHFVNGKLKHGLQFENRYQAEIKNIDIEETYGTHSVVPPLSTPFEFFKYCARQAQSPKYIESDFVFYEDIDGFNFKTISSLIDTDPVEDYYLADATKETPAVRQYKIIRNLEYASSEFDAIKSQKAGMYDNNVSVIDPVLKIYKEQPFNYHFRKNRDNAFMGLGSDGFTSEYSAERSFDGGSHSRFMIGNISDGAYRDVSYISGRTIDVHGNILDSVAHWPFSRYRYLNYTISKMAQLNTKIILKVTISGDVNRKVGEVIRVFVPQKSASEEYKQRYNLFYGEDDPRFIITGIKHSYSFAEDIFTTTMEVVKDSLGQPLVQTQRYREVEQTSNFSLL